MNAEAEEMSAMFLVGDRLKKTRQQVTIIRSEKLLFLKIKMFSPVGREKPPYQYDITVIWILLNLIKS